MSLEDRRGISITKLILCPKERSYLSFEANHRYISFISKNHSRTQTSLQLEFCNQVFCISVVSPSVGV